MSLYLFFYFLSLSVFIKKVVKLSQFLLFFLSFFFLLPFVKKAEWELGVVRSLLTLICCGKYLAQETRAGTPVKTLGNVFVLEHESHTWSWQSCWKVAMKGLCISWMLALDLPWERTLYRDVSLWATTNTSIKNWFGLFATRFYK